MENFRLKVFRIVAHHLNFSRAAEELSLSQPAVTQQIKTLEDEYGLPLFDRSGGRITLTPAGKALLVAESPLTQAKAIKTPLMVVQGANDPRVNVRESSQIVAAVRDNGKPVEYLVAPDEGHGFARPINNLALVTEMERFFARYLGGRYQPEVPADIAAQLKILVVDPKTVNGTVQLSGALAAKP